DCFNFISNIIFFSFILILLLLLLLIFIFTSIIAIIIVLPLIMLSYATNVGIHKCRWGAYGAE
ncbi:hypothetical protein PPACK8108_LOCUS21071, partial [Phakopsora pachyrhizi]